MCRQRRLRGDLVCMLSKTFLATHQLDIHFWTELLGTLYRQYCPSRVQESGGYCWPTPKCGKSCLGHAFVEGLRIARIQRGNSSRIAWKWDDQQYPGVNRAPVKTYGNDNTTTVEAQDCLALASSEYR